MTNLPMWALVAAKATLALTIAFTACAAARRARASLRHAIYAATFALLLLLPVVPRFVPAVRVPVDGSSVPAFLGSSALSGPRAAGRGPELSTSTPPRNEATEEPRNWARWAAAVYLAGVALLLAWLAAGIVRLRRIRAGGEVWLDGTRMARRLRENRSHGAAAAGGSLPAARPILVVLSNDVAVPLTFGFRQQTIVLPAGARAWETESLSRAICHELAHVRRNDWALQLLARVACAVYWPHALVWVAWRRLCVEAERACDDAVVTRFEAATYAEQLVTFARTLTRTTQVPALGMVSRTRLSERVHAILDPSQRRGPHGRAASVATVVLMAALLGVFGPLRVVAAMDDETGATAAAPLAKVMYESRLRADAQNESDINASIPGDGTPLLIAAKHGRIDEMKDLLARGADPNVPSPGDGNPLIAASHFGQLEAARLLLDRGARVNDIVPGDETALIQAAWQGHLDVVKLLISRGADVNLGVEVDFSDNGHEYRTPLRMARRGGHQDVVDALLAAGAYDKKRP